VAKDFLMPVMCMRFCRGWNCLKKAVAENACDMVLAVSFRRLSAMPAWGQIGSHPGGVLLDLHIHDTDCVNYLFGRSESVYATGVIGAGGMINHVSTQYHFPGGRRFAPRAAGCWRVVSTWVSRPFASGRRVARG
jgi:predicted dehydrogenase